MKNRVYVFLAALGVLSLFTAAWATTAIVAPPVAKEAAELSETPVSLVSVTGGPKVITIEIMTDDFPSETSWELVHKETGEVVASAGPLADPATLHTWNVEVTLVPNCYNFTIFDAFGDGICSGFGPGFYNVFHDEELVCSGCVFLDSETCSDIGGECVPAVCGNGVVEGDEECDPPDDAACPGDCQADCTCPPDEEIPTVSEWGLIAMAVLSLAVGCVVIRRSQRQAA